MHRPVRVRDVVGQVVVGDPRDERASSACGRSVVARAVRRYSYSVSRIFADAVVAVDEGEAEHPRQPRGVRREQQAAARAAAARAGPPARPRAPRRRRAGSVPGTDARVPVGVQRREVAHVHVPAGDGRQRHRQATSPTRRPGPRTVRCAGPGSWRPSSRDRRAGRSDGRHRDNRQGLLRTAAPQRARRPYVGRMTVHRLRRRDPLPRRGAGAARPAGAGCPTGFRAIVVDNGSRDDTAEVARGARRHGRRRAASRATAPPCTRASRRRPPTTSR